MSSTCRITDLPCWIEYSFNELEQIILQVYGWIMDGLVSLIGFIPVPDFLQNIGSYTLPPEMAFYANAFEIPSGLAIVSTAYGLRFLLRRIPLIG